MLYDSTACARYTPVQHVADRYERDRLREDTLGLRARDLGSMESRYFSNAAISWRCPMLTSILSSRLRYLGMLVSNSAMASGVNLSSRKLVFPYLLARAWSWARRILSVPSVISARTVGRWLPNAMSSMLSAPAASLQLYSQSTRSGSSGRRSRASVQRAISRSIKRLIKAANMLSRVGK